MGAPYGSLVFDGRGVFVLAGGIDLDECGWIDELGKGEKECIYTHALEFTVLVHALPKFHSHRGKFQFAQHFN